MHDLFFGSSWLAELVVLAIILPVLGLPIAAGMRKRARLNLVRDAEASIVSCRLAQDGTPIFANISAVAARVTMRVRAQRQS